MKKAFQEGERNQLHQTVLLNWVRLGLKIYLGFNTCHTIGDFGRSSVVGKNSGENGKGTNGEIVFTIREMIFLKMKILKMKYNVSMFVLWWE